MTASPYRYLGTPGMVLHYLLARWKARVQRSELGEITEKTIIIAGFALITLAVLAVIGAKLMSTVNDVNTDPP